MRRISVSFFVAFFFIQFVVAQQIYISSANSKGIERFLTERRISTALFVYESSFITSNKFDRDKLSNFIDRNVPNKNATGIAVLDCEGVLYKNLFNNTSRLREESISTFIDIIRTAKKLRPKMQWSFYSIPSREFYNLGATWRNTNLKLTKLISELDFIAPSVYILFGENEISRDKTIEYFNENIKFSLELGQRYGKLVLPIVWHRYHPWNKKYGEQLIPPRTFADYLSTIQNVRYNNKKVAGIIWWHSEEYNYKVRSTNRIFSNEYRNKNKDDVQYEMFDRYFREIKRKIRK